MSNTDALRAATEAGKSSGQIFAQVAVSAEFVVLKKGVGKIPFDEGQHAPNERRTAITLMLSPLAETGLSYGINREVIAESRDWGRIIWPSIQAQGIDYAGDIDQKFARVQMVGTGQTWTGRDGKTRENTVPKFLEFFDTEEECRNAYYAAGGSDRSDAADDDAGGAAAMAHKNTNGAGKAEGGAGKDLALEFARVLAVQADGDKEKLASLISNTPQVAQHFTVDSPEIQALLA